MLSQYPSISAIAQNEVRLHGTQALQTRYDAVNADVASAAPFYMPNLS